MKIITNIRPMALLLTSVTIQFRRSTALEVDLVTTARFAFLLSSVNITAKITNIKSMHELGKPAWAFSWNPSESRSFIGFCILREGWRGTTDGVILNTPYSNRIEVSSELRVGANMNSSVVKCTLTVHGITESFRMAFVVSKKRGYADEVLTKSVNVFVIGCNYPKEGSVITQISMPTCGTGCIATFSCDKKSGYFGNSVTTECSADGVFVKSPNCIKFRQILGLALIALSVLWIILIICCYTVIREKTKKMPSEENSAVELPSAVSKIPSPSEVLEVGKDASKFCLSSCASKKSTEFIAGELTPNNVKINLTKDNKREKESNISVRASNLTPPKRRFKTQRLGKKFRRHDQSKPSVGSLGLGDSVLDQAQMYKETAASSSTGITPASNSLAPIQEPSKVESRAFTGSSKKRYKIQRLTRKLRNKKELRNDNNNLQLDGSEQSPQGYQPPKFSRRTQKQNESLMDKLLRPFKLIF